jgi:hypothetical protein
MKLRDLIKMNSINDGTRTLSESIAIPEVLQALEDWKRETNQIGVLIGGCAVSYYARPRGTTDVDFLFLTSNEIPSKVKGFKRTQLGAFQHNKTHVEIEVVTPSSINLDLNLAKLVIDTAILIDGLYIASPTGLVALKLQRMKRYDEGDIAALIETGKVDLANWPISPEQYKIFKQIEEKNK